VVARQWNRGRSGDGGSCDIGRAEKPSRRGVSADGTAPSRFADYGQYTLFAAYRRGHHTIAGGGAGGDGGLATPALLVGPDGVWVDGGGDIVIARCRRPSRARGPPAPASSRRSAGHRRPKCTKATGSRNVSRGDLPRAALAMVGAKLLHRGLQNKRARGRERRSRPSPATGDQPGGAR